MNAPLISPLSILLGIRPGAKVSVVHPPQGFLERLEPLPDGIELVSSAQTGLDVTVFFPKDKVELLERLPGLVRGMAVTGGVWACWPNPEKKGGRGALTEDFIRLAALEMGLVDNKKIVLDDTWSALRLVWKPRGARLERPPSASA